MSRRPSLQQFTLAHFLEILKVAQHLHNEHGEPIPDMGSNSSAKVQSSISVPFFQTSDGKHIHKTFRRKAALLFYLLVKNHCLHNGNKRMAILSLSFFVFINKREFIISDSKLYWLAKRTASSQNQHKALQKIHSVLLKCVRKRNQSSIILDSLISPKKATSNKLRKKFREYKCHCYVRKKHTKWVV